MSEPETKPWIPSHPQHSSHDNERLTERPTGCKRVGSTFGWKADSRSKCKGLPRMPRARKNPTASAGSICRGSLVAIRRLLLPARADRVWWSRERWNGDRAARRPCGERVRREVRYSRGHCLETSHLDLVLWHRHLDRPRPFRKRRPHTNMISRKVESPKL
jgi:hypothetical protein